MEKVLKGLVAASLIALSVSAMGAEKLALGQMDAVTAGATASASGSAWAKGKDPYVVADQTSIAGSLSVAGNSKSRCSFCSPKPTVKIDVGYGTNFTYAEASGYGEAYADGYTSASSHIH